MTSRALVLSGGGPVGVAWQSAIVAGLAAAGADLASADLVVGTSAGSIVGAQVALGHDLAGELERNGAAGGVSFEDAPEAIQSAPTPERMQRLLMAIEEAFAAELPIEHARRTIGALALDADTPDEDEFIGVIARRLPDVPWPERFVCTAVDAESGEFQAWGGSHGVELARGVASSCAVPGVYPAITIEGRRYVDGGMRSLANADLAKGHERVLVISVTGVPMIDGDSGLLRYIRQLGQEIEALEAEGAEVELVVPDDMMIAMNAMNFGFVADGAEAGLRQVERIADRLLDFWA